MSPTAPTRRQADTLRAMRTISKREGRPPLMRELAAEMGISRPVVYEHLRALLAKGLVTTCGDQYSSARYVPRDECPTCGRTLPEEETECRS